MEKFQQSIEALRIFSQGIINGEAYSFPVGRLLLISQPFIIRLAFDFWILHDGVTVLDADGIIQSADCSGAAPEVSELSGFIQGGGVPDNMVMNMGFVNVCADNKGMIAFCESPCQFAAKPIGFFWGDLTRTERLTEMIGNHIIFATDSAGLFYILLLRQKNLNGRA